MGEHADLPVPVLSLAGYDGAALASERATVDLSGLGNVVVNVTIRDHRMLYTRFG